MKNNFVFERPFTTVDVVIFSVFDAALQILLVKRSLGDNEPFPGKWALPGGFVNVDMDDTLEQAAKRKLLEKTALKSPYLEQLGSWGGKKRDPRGWTASHVYFALIAADGIKLTAGGNAADAGWHSIEHATQLRLAFDHGEILKAAIDRLRSKVEYTSLPAFLLREPFTIPELQRMYEVVLGRELDKSGFRTRMLAANFLVEMGTQDVGAPNPAMTYRLRDRKNPIQFPRTFYARGSR
jgi:8-oxo-dGTP diphosphatase